MTSAQSRLDTVLDQVRVYAELGLQVLPIHGIVDGKCACGNKKCSSPGKHPMFSTGVYGATADIEWLESIYRSNFHANIGVAAGRTSGILLLDLDTQEAIDAVRKAGIPKTWGFRTGKGEQYAFKYPKLLDDYYVQNAVQLAPGVDIRSDGGYSVFPPSTHWSGRTYEWIYAPDTTPLASIPQWLMDQLIIKNRTASSGPREDEHSEIHEKGGRNNYLFKVGTSMRAARFSGEEIRLVLHERNMRSCSPPLEENEVNEIVDSIVNRYASGVTDEMTDRVREKLGDIDKLPQILLTAPMTDTGNSECLVELFGQDFRACKAIARTKTESKGIFKWSGSVWEEDLSREFRTCAMWTARGRKAISAHAETVEQRKRLYKFANDSENVGKLEACCEMASTNEAISMREDQWDNEPLRLAVINGVLDLKNGTFEEPNREQYVTQRANVEYDEDAVCPVWEQTLKQIFKDSPEVIPYLQRVFGYCLTGLIDEHLIWFWYGDGANGKSTLINTFKAVLGDLAETTSFSTFDTKNDNGRNDGLAELRGKRFVAASEGEQGKSIAEAKIKLIASGDEVSCRFLYNNLFTYKPTYKVVLASNHLPEIKGTDRGIWRRVHLVRFNQKFEGDARDPDLDDKLRAELSGIFNWCLAGLQDYWERGGVDPPESVLYSTRALEVQSDFFQQWFDERLTPAENGTVRKSLAYIDYRNYLRTSGEVPIVKVAWTNRMLAKGINFSVKVRGDYSAKGWRLDTDVY